MTTHNDFATLFAPSGRLVGSFFSTPRAKLAAPSVSAAITGTESHPFLYSPLRTPQSNPPPPTATTIALGGLLMPYIANCYLTSSIRVAWPICMIGFSKGGM